MFPAQIKIKDRKFLYIKWNDNTECTIKLANLRRNCPCAVCNSERDKQGKSYIPLFNEDEVTVKDVKIIGYYAVGIVWNDGHNTGIYEFERLKTLAEK